jgi:hypothetical protein
MLMDEMEIAVDLQNQSEAQRALLGWMALSAQPNMAADPKGVKKQHQAFTKTLKGLTGE